MRAPGRGSRSTSSRGARRSRTACSTPIPIPGNFLVETEADGHVARAGASTSAARSTLPDAVRDADREIWWGLLDDDSAQRGRALPHGARALGPARAAPTRSRRPRIATGSARSPQPLATHGDVPLVRRLRRASSPRRRGACSALGGLALPREAAAALAPAPRRRRRDRHARRARAVPAGPRRPDRNRAEDSSLAARSPRCRSRRSPPTSRRRASGRDRCARARLPVVAAE